MVRRIAARQPIRMLYSRSFDGRVSQLVLALVRYSQGCSQCRKRGTAAVAEKGMTESEKNACSQLLSVASVLSVNLNERLCAG